MPNNRFKQLNVSSIAVLLFLVGLSDSVTAQDIDGDTDRDGKIAYNELEESLEETQSVIVIANCDDDDCDGAPDNQNSVIDGRRDCSDLEPIFIHATGKLPDDFVGLSLDEIDDESYSLRHIIRIFDSFGKEIIGPTRGALYEFDEQEKRKIELEGMQLFVEGLEFARSVVLRFEIGDDVDELIIKVAPFILLPTTQRPINNMIADPGGDLAEAYTSKFVEACAIANVKTWVVEPDLERSGSTWVQDEIQWGYSQTPRFTMKIALQMYREDAPTGLEGVARKLLKPDHGFFQVWPYPHRGSINQAHDSGGNLQVTPPTPDYPLGRIYFGSVRSAPRLSRDDDFNQRAIDDEFRKFFFRQQVQTPIELSSDWLSVGHVDEALSFVPAQLPNRKNGFAMLIASPKLGLKLLKKMDPNDTIDERYISMFRKRSDPRTDPLTVGEILSTTYDVGRDENGDSKTMTFEEYQLALQSRFLGNKDENNRESIRAIMQEGLGLSDEQIVEMPILFWNPGNIWDAAPIVPNPVNVSSMGKFTLIGEPHWPQFKKEMDLKLASIGQRPLWIDNWAEFHIQGGGVHCSSNVLRQPFSAKWWDVTVKPPAGFDE